MRLDETVRQQVQAQVDVVSVDGRLRQVRDVGAHHHLLDLARLVVTGEQGEIGRDVRALESRRSGFARLAEGGCRVPRVEDGAVLCDVRDAYC